MAAMLARTSLPVVLLASLVTLVACKNDPPPEPVRDEPVPPASATAPLASSIRRVPPSMARPGMGMNQPRRPIAARPANSVAPADDDPLKGKFSLAEATAGVPGKGALLATIDTDMGVITCQLFEDKAPVSVANFVGLARGVRPWKTPEGKWVKKPAYDGTVFHRIIKGFMIQGGDPTGTGAGQPGYNVPDEVWEGAYHDRAGLLCMANRGADTNGAQFFITDGAAAHLDNRYTILGECAPLETIHKIAAVETQGEKPASPPKMKSVTIKRGPSPIAAASAAPSASASAPSPVP